jgi:hypothetical protein
MAMGITTAKVKSVEDERGKPPKSRSEAEI